MAARTCVGCGRSPSTGDLVGTWTTITVTLSADRHVLDCHTGELCSPQCWGPAMRKYADAAENAARSAAQRTGASS